MALVIEDGTGSNPAANSYQNVAELRTYAELRGVDLSKHSNKTLETLLIQAMDYLESQRARFKGVKTLEAQPLEWPRSDVWDVEKPGAVLPVNQVPRLVQYSQLALAIEALKHDLMPNTGTPGEPVITKEKIGPIEITYSTDTPKRAFTSAFSKPAGLLSPLFKNNGLRMVKV